MPSSNEGGHRRVREMPSGWAAAAPEGEDDGVGDGQAGSATEPGAKDSSDRRSQPSRPIIGWLDCGEIAFAKFSGEDADMACIHHRQPGGTGKPGPPNCGAGPRSKSAGSKGRAG